MWKSKFGRPTPSTRRCRRDWLVSTQVVKILKDPNRNILLVLNNRVYVHREFYERSKHPGHAVMVREACQLLGCPNVIYDFAPKEILDLPIIRDKNF